MRKIILPTDFSENAYNALRFACQLFKYEKSEIILLNTYADKVYTDENLLSKELIDELKAVTRAKAEMVLKEISSKVHDEFCNPRHSVRSIAAFGDLVDEVNSLVNSENADLVIMGTRGATNDRDLGFGSNTLLVLKYVQCPVLAIPANFNYQEPKNILFPTNFLIPYQKRELKIVGEIARDFKSIIHFLYLSKHKATSARQKDNLEFLKQQFYNIRLEEHQSDELQKEKAIEEFIAANKIDLLVMVNSRHTYLEDMLLTSTIDKVGLQPKVPLLALQNFNRESI
ncbi:universal stress protein [Salegentibacter salegens]|uniref:Nucleotide-binding universal stress protein, UspA family n=1 Tax=Salegentibacter salegens TaxID=143223 RepID=A0A1M7HGU0_9FLAO|nr:universal stress protein [Salegentibacter salegens]PRX44076.1 nucleotide-binding universal stress UspA family protein [Salegentibacter salegens]SHM27679.1 Nucleotide-binding universal stress protein, UspA family [Salegentibacter salegens]